MPKILTTFPTPSSTPTSSGGKSNGSTPRPTTLSGGSSPPKSKHKTLDQASKVTVVQRPTLYKELTVNGKVIKPEDCVISVALAKKLLGWESEKDYTVRMMKEKPGTKEEQAQFSNEILEKMGAQILIERDEEGERVVCWHNCRNRPFDLGHSKKLAQDILNRNWAGPLTMPGETVNGETIIIGRTGQVESGQHRLVALILASQIWIKQKLKWESKWPTEPVLESLIVQGVSESPNVLRTLDNVKPRTLSDVFYTSDLFLTLTPIERKECSRMLDRAVDFLWTRTGASKKSYQTHSESLGFVERHPKVLQCLRHLFDENKDRVISNLRLSAGQCAGILYLQGSSASDGDEYRAMDVPTEKKLNWDNWDKALEFWVRVGKDATASPVGPITESLAMLVDPEEGTQGRTIEKHAILAKAWHLFLVGDPITVERLELETEVKDGKNKLVEFPDFGGIDLGPPHTSESIEDPTPTVITTESENIRKKKAEEIAKKLQERREEEARKRAEESTKTPPAIRHATLQDEINALKLQHADKVLIFRGSKTYHAWGEDAQVLGKILKVGIKINTGLPKAEIPLSALENGLERLMGAGYKVAICEQQGKETKVSVQAKPKLKTVPAKPPLRGGTN